MRKMSKEACRRKNGFEKEKGRLPHLGGKRRFLL